MAIGERIKRARNLRKLTQMELGKAIGFAESTADVRIAQYETGVRTPKEEYVKAIAAVLRVSPAALTVPDIETYFGVFQTLFALEDLYGLKADRVDDEICLTLDRNNSASFFMMFEMFSSWVEQRKKLESDTISKADYDNWRYNYPASATYSRKRK
jgi:transcriptional regulator with XRE-family HTH domain